MQFGYKILALFSKTCDIIFYRLGVVRHTSRKHMSNLKIAKKLCNFLIEDAKEDLSLVETLQTCQASISTSR